MDRIPISRRSFIGAAAAATAALAATGCSPDNTLREADAAEATQATTPDGHRLDAEFDPNLHGEWVTVPCWHNCGGSRCMLRAYTVDGVVMRVKTDDTHDDTFELPQQRACPRGRSQRQHLFGADRIKYPPEARALAARRRR